MAKWYLGLDENKKALFWMIALALVVLLALLPLGLLPGGISYALGWFIGSLVEILSFLSIIRFSLTLFQASSTHKETIGATLGAGALRFLAYAGVLVLSALCTFAPSWVGGFTSFNFYTTFLALLPMPFVVLVSHFLASHRNTVEAKKKALGKDEDLPE